MNNYQRKFAEQHGVDTLLATGALAADNDAALELDVSLLELAGALRELAVWQAIDDVRTPGYDEQHERAMRRLKAARAAVDQCALAAFPRAR